MRKLIEWEKFPLIVKWSVIGGTGLLTTLGIWIWYRERAKKAKLKISHTTAPKRRIEKSLPLDVDELTSDMATMVNLTDEFLHIDATRPLDPSPEPDAQTPLNGSVRSEELVLPAGDDEEIAMSIHSQISRGLQDLQRGLELSALFKGIT